MKDENGKLDRLLTKLVSRKLLVFFASTLFVVLSATGVFGMAMTFDQWMTIAVAYIGTQGAQNIVTSVLLARQGVATEKNKEDEL